MEKKSMEKSWMGRGVPIWYCEGIPMPLIRVGKVTFVTAKPIVTNARNLKEAKSLAINFEKNYDCQATVCYDTEWQELCNYLKVNFAAKEFVKINGLKVSEVLLLDTMTEGEGFVLAGGCTHGLNEIFHGFISGEDADGEPQAPKSIFLTLRFNSNQIG